MCYRADNLEKLCKHCSAPPRKSSLHFAVGKIAFRNEVLPRFEFGLPDSESGVLTVTPQDRYHNMLKDNSIRLHVCTIASQDNSKRKCATSIIVTDCTRLLDFWVCFSFEIAPEPPDRKAETIAIRLSALKMILPDETGQEDEPPLIHAVSTGVFHFWCI